MIMEQHWVMVEPGGPAPAGGGGILPLFIVLDEDVRLFDLTGCKVRP